MWENSDRRLGDLVPRSLSIEVESLQEISTLKCEVSLENFLEREFSIFGAVQSPSTRVFGRTLGLGDRVCRAAFCAQDLHSQLGIRMAALRMVGALAKALVWGGQ